jgi:hypothetical protein
MQAEDKPHRVIHYLVTDAGSDKPHRPRVIHYLVTRGGSRGGTPGVPPPPKIGMNMIFLCIIVIFHTKYPKIFRASLRNWKKYDFLA